jgi:MoxR-like ATPase
MSDVAAIQNLVQKRTELKKEIAKIIVGQDDVIDQILLSIFSGGHALLVGVPGLAKTLMVNTISQALGLDFKRIQFTPDLMPSDILGSEILDESRNFKFIKGPIFANIILADEINRTPPKTQAALLEAMQERSVTIAGQNYKLDLPYFVLATQNPIEQEGTYPLPEAQVDRFMLKVVLDYPKMEEEKQIIRSNVRKEGLAKVNKVVDSNHILNLRELVREVYLDEKIEQYIVDIVFATRNPENYNLNELSPLISFGCSPRASLNLALAGKAHAFLQNRAFVVPEDIRAVAADVMRHRIGLTYEAEAENMDAAQIIVKILNRVEVP